jgi:hypothetical protein
MARDTLHQAAVTFLMAHHAEHLSCDRQLLADRCIEHIRLIGPATRVDAAVVTLQAMGDITSRSTGAHLDLDKTTSYAVFITDPASGKCACFTATDLLRLSRDHAFHASLRARAAAPH